MPLQPQQSRKAGTGIRVVIDHHQPMPCRIRRYWLWSLCGWRQRIRLQDERQSDLERGAFPQSFAMRFNNSLMQFNKILDESQADAETSLRLCRALVCLDEQLEDMRQHVRSNADSPVAYGQDGLSLFAGRRQPD